MILEGLTFHPNHGKKIGEWLLHLGLLTKRQLDVAMEAQSTQPELRVGEILIQRGFITREELSETLALQEVFNGRSSLKDFTIAPKTLSLLPEQFCLQHEVLPLAQIAMRLLVATADGRNFQALDKITLHTGLIVVSIEIAREELFAALGKSFNREVNPPALKLSLLEPPSPAPFLPVQRLGSPGADAQVINELVSSLFDEAFQLQASDIYLTPSEMVLEVRCRADGIMRKILDVPKNLEAAVIKRVQQIAGSSVSDPRRSQLEGGPLGLYDESVGLGLANVELRLTSAQTVWGESLKIRIIRTNAPVQSLASLGLDSEDLLSYKRMLRGRGGLILLTGPGGSGKRSLLQASIGYLDKLSNHVILIDTAFTKPIAGLTQLSPNSRPGLTLETCIQQAQDHAPDILIINGVSTSSQLEAAIRASLKGVLVLTTLKASSTGAALAFLSSLNLPAPLLAAGLSGVVGTRLLRRNCPDCLIEYAATSNEKAFVGDPPGSPTFFARGLGCLRCSHTGYQGQVGIFELLPITPAVAELLVRPNVSPAALEAQAGAGITRLLDDAKRKILQGVTSIPEVYRVLGDWSDDE